MTTAYLVMRLHSWDSFEPAPGCWSPFPVSIKGEGLGFLVVYATLEEAEAESDGGRFTIAEVRVPDKSEGDHNG